MARAAVACGHPATRDAAVGLLEAGGNAFDAAVAAGFAAAVAEPTLTSLGGGGFLLAHRADGDTTAFDFFVDTPGRGAASGEPHFLPVTLRFPGSEQVFNVGLGSVAVPGVLRGLLDVHARLGRVPLGDVVAPAVALARDGVEVSPHQAYFMGLLEPIMTLTAASRALFSPGGRLPVEGEVLANPDLAGFLAALPGSAEAFYAGDLARAVEAEMRAGAGLLTAADLGAYRVRAPAPLRAGYRDCTLWTVPAPSFGGRLLAASLEQLGRASLAAGPREIGHLQALVSVMEAVDALRARELADAPVFQRGTTHISVCDAAGNAASLTTSNGEGSGYVVPGTGIMLNNMLGEDDLHPHGFFQAEPGTRVASGMSPSLLLQAGEPRFVLGSGGSKRIRTALLQVISLLVDFELPVEEAVVHPRLHWDGQQVQAEPGFPEAALVELARLRPVNRWSATDVYFGGVHAVDARGRAAGDPRRGGAARVLATRP